MKPIWTILILTIPNRAKYLQELMERLKPQIMASNGMVTVLLDDRLDVSIGQKRNDLVNRCQTEYSSFIDDDDLVSEDYVKSHLSILNEYPGIDGIGFKGVLSQDGRGMQLFKHSGEYNGWYQQSEGGQTVYYRCLNHWNVIKNDYRKQCPFPDLNYAEDHAQSIDMQNAGLINNYIDIIDKPMYYYQVRTGISVTTLKK